MTGGETLSGTWPRDDGEMAGRIRAFDWAATPLGPLAAWPQSLRTAVELCLAWLEPASVFWGPAFIQIYNDAYARTPPVAHPAMFGRSALANWPDEEAPLAPVLARILADGRTLTAPDRPLAGTAGTAEERTFTFTFAPLRDETGAAVGIFHTAVETTARWRAERGRAAALATIEADYARLRALFAQAPTAIAALQGPELRFEIANPAYAAIFGPHRDYIGRTVREVFADTSASTIWETLDRIYRSGEPLVGTEWSLLIDRRGSGRREERFYDFVVQPILDEAGATTGIFIQALDTTTQVLARRALEAERQQLLAILGQLPVGVIIAEAPSGRLLLGNAQVETIWRHEFLDAAAIPEYARYRGFWPDGRPYRPEEWPLARALAHGEVVAAERIAFVRGDETRGIMEVSATPVRDAGGAIVAGVVVFADVTGRVEAEAERDHLLLAERASRAAAEEAVRARDTFLSIAAHELRTPLTGLKGLIQLLRRRQDRQQLDAERLAASLASLDQSADRLTALTDDLLDVARIRTGQLPLVARPLALGDEVARAVAVARDRAGAAHTLTLDAPAELPQVRADAGRIEQVLTNLLDNAIKYSPAGGTVAVRVRVAGEGIAVAIEDQGIGLPPGAATTVFTPFGRAENAATSGVPGMGLGLYICRSIVERHGGTIRAESAGEGRGTTITFWLPLAGPPEGSPPGAA